MDLVHIVSFSGGKTSGKFVHEMEKRRKAGWDVRYIFMDTGAEHPKTYEFIRNLVQRWGIDLVCLRVEVNPILGKANSYRVISLDDIGPDLQPWIDITKKYGTPYFGGAFCTRTLKIEVCERYCLHNFRDYKIWLGMRMDEQQRIWGEKLFPMLRKMNFDNLMMNDLFRYLRRAANVEEMQEILEKNFLIYGEISMHLIQRVVAINLSKQCFMAEIMDDEKEDVNSWWAKQPFTLELPEHLGNCVFCIKKGLNKVALAMRDEPELLRQFYEVVNSPAVRVVERRQQSNKIMYRQANSLDSIKEMYADWSTDQIKATIKGAGGEKSGSCSDGCEAFVVGNTTEAQLSLFGDPLVKEKLKNADC